MRILYFLIIFLIYVVLLQAGRAILLFEHNHMLVLN